MRLLICFLLLATPEAILAQRVVPVPGFGPAAVTEPTTPPARMVHDARAGLEFHLPAGWNFSRQDGELSTFALDARSAGPTSRMHEVANLNFNPYPRSTFSGAIFYVSSRPHADEASCAREAATALPRKEETVTLDGVPFHHGYGELAEDCVISRDEVYTTLRQGSCLRFDLVINTFCGASSGARDITKPELENINHRLEGILQSVRFDGVGGGAAKRH